MKISELVKKLTDFQVKNGDVQVVPSIDIREKGIGLDLVILNAEAWMESEKAYREGILQPIAAPGFPEAVCLIKFG